MNLTHEGLSLWYGTPDAPAPGDDGLVPRKGAALVVGVHPPNPSNTLAVHYRVNQGSKQGIVQTVSGRQLRTDFERQIQYFAVVFPAFVTGDVVEYSPVLSCAGRQVPAPHIAQRFPSKFHLAAPSAPAAAPPAPAARAVQGQPRFGVRMDFVASVRVQFGPPQFVCDTAAGMRVNFIVREGTVQGDGFKGKVLECSSDDMIVRPDGMGVVRIRAAFALDDGATLDVDSGGYVDFGAEGYRRALARDLPDRSPLVISPLISTRQPKYRFLSRIQCVGVGETHLDAGQASYEIYAAWPRVPT
jgi:hypothetical protein